MNLFLVQRTTGGEDMVEYGGTLRGVGELAFRSRKEAEACRLRLDQQMREQAPPPFEQYDDVEDLSSLSEEQFRAALEQLGINPPELNNYEFYEWDAWWRRTSREVSEEHTAAIWKLCDKFSFYSIVEIPLQD